MGWRVGWLMRPTIFSSPSNRQTVTPPLTTLAPLTYILKIILPAEFIFMNFLCRKVVYTIYINSAGYHSPKKIRIHIQNICRVSRKSKASHFYFEFQIFLSTLVHICNTKYIIGKSKVKQGLTVKGEIRLISPLCHLTSGPTALRLFQSMAAAAIATARVIQVLRRPPSGSSGGESTGRDSFMYFTRYIEFYPLKEKGSTQIVIVIIE